MRPRTCCAAFSNFHTERGVAEFYAHLSRLQSFCDPVNGNPFHWLEALAALNLKDRSKNSSLSSAWVMVGNFAQEEKFSSPCNGLFALEGISFSTGSLRVPRGERYGLCNGPSNNCASFDTAGRGLIPYREASLLTSCNVSNFSKVHRK